jgi:hypothetical protein
MLKEVYVGPIQKNKNTIDIFHMVSLFAGATRVLVLVNMTQLFYKSIWFCKIAPYVRKKNQSAREDSFLLTNGYQYLLSLENNLTTIRSVQPVKRKNSLERKIFSCTIFALI